MKKNFYTILIAGLLFSGMLHGQDLILESFDDPNAIGNWINSTAGSYTLSGSADAAEGNGAVALNYNLVADQSWGGSVDIEMTPSGGATYGDLTEMDGISFWYKVTTPASDVSSATWTTKLFVNSTGGWEEWHASLTGVIDDMSGEWTKAEIPFSAFAIPSWLTTYDGVLYQDQVAKIQMQIVSGAGTTVVGEILVDGMGAYGQMTVAGTLLESFDAVGSIGNWINSTGGSYTFTNSADAVEGAASACLDYVLIADQDWGGSVDLQITPSAGDVFPDLSDDAGVRFNYKVTSPASVTAGVTLNVKLFVNSSGNEEEWHAPVSGVIGDTSGDWQEAKLPFANFSIPSWLTTYDGVLYQDQITKIEVQIVANTMGIETFGALCFDNMTSYSEANVEIFEGFDLNDFNMPSTTVNSWINSNDGSYTVTPSDDTVEGDSSLCLSYNLVADQGWGGSVDMSFIPVDGAPVFQDMTGHLGISFWYKVTDPADVPGNVSFVIKAFVNSTGGSEEWHRTVGGVLANDSGEWTHVLIPFTAFAIPNWLTTHDGVLYQDQISEIQFQILGQEGTTTNGGICFDKLQSYDDEEVMVGTVTPISGEVKIYPNPTTSQLFIDGLEQVRSVQVFSVNGQLIQTENLSTTIDLSNLQNGFYILKIYTDKQVYSAKVMKQ